MANLSIFWPNFSDPSVLFTPTFSGGSWQAALPLTNLQDRRLHRPARSTNVLAASTQFDVDMKTSRLIGVVAIAKHTMTTAGTFRVRLYTTTGHVGLQYDSGTITPFPAGQTLEDTQGLNVPIVVFPNVSARYAFVEFVDTANPAGVLDVSRLFIGAANTPTINMSYNAALGLETSTERVPMDGGAATFNERPQRRTLNGVLEQMPEAEAFANFWKMFKQTGISKQVWVTYDTADVEPQRYNRNFLAVFKQPNALKAPYLARYENAFSLVEEL